MDTISRNSFILIGGLGLVGGSAAKALKNAGFDCVYAFDRDMAALAEAQKEGVIARGFTDARDIPEVDFVLCCLPPSLAAGFCADISGSLKAGAVFAEAGGVKRGIIEDVEARLAQGREFLPLHTMAGSEKKGYENSDAGLFRGSALIVTPTSRTGANARKWANELKAAFGCAEIMELSPEQHDEAIARVSHIPHAVALAIRAADKGRDLERIAGGSYRGATRVADINAPLWAELFSLNKDNLISSIEALKAELTRLESAVSAGDQNALETLIKEMSQG